MAGEVTQTDRFIFFWDGWPSQWHPSRFAIDGVAYNCCEQFMMAEKARVFGDGESLERILRARSPAEQKALGRRVRGFDESVWNRVCRGIVYTGNLAKFSQDESLARLLLDTGSRTIVEASPQDCIWGIGFSADEPRAHEPAQWRGTNWLGIALMQVRQTLRQRAQELELSLDPELSAQLSRREAMRGSAETKGQAPC